MSQSRITSLVKKLEEERLRTLRRLAHLGESLRTEIDPDVDEADADLVEHEKTVALVYSLERKLASIDRALWKAQEGTYGICELCGEPIDPARLEAVPETTLCLKCKAATEQGTPSKTVYA